ncbi:MAG: cytochrome c biogenesis protein CcsA [Bryobacterales bacterium]|nr:cytochrome c biogenesis protein CcsA [Bryobacterales bacterium]
MQDSSILWLRVAAILYFPGLIVALLSFIRHHPGRFRAALVSFLMGTTIHLVAIVEESLEVGSFPANNFFEAISLLGLVLAIVFLICHWLYRFESLAVLIMPLVFLMALTGSAAGSNPSWQLGTMRNIWLTTHVVFIMLGYAGLLVTAAVSVFYLWRERQLKQKQLPSAGDAVPPLMTLDLIVARSLAWGFLALTVNLVAGDHLGVERKRHQMDL